MIVEKPALSTVNVQISASKEAVPIQAPNISGFRPSVWQRPRAEVTFTLAAIKNTCEEVRDYSDKNENGIVIACTKVEEQFNPVKKFPNLFPQTIPPDLTPLREVNQCIDPEPQSE